MLLTCAAALLLAPSADVLGGTVTRDAYYSVARLTLQEKHGLSTCEEVGLPADLFSVLMENEKLAENPDICAKIAELTPMDVAGVRVIIASKRVAMDTSEIEEVIEIVRQHVL